MDLVPEDSATPARCCRQESAEEPTVMLQVYNSITQQHDLRLVIVAGFICFLAAYPAFSLVGRAVEAGAKARAWWIGAGAFATGSGVWATHFIATIAFQPNLPVGYALGPTLLSILIAMLIS